MPPTFVDEPSIEFVSKYKFSEGLAAVEVNRDSSDGDVCERERRDNVTPPGKIE